ncbi:MAG: YicC family protein [Firmicutes bacterium HGW-Firmicutes-15]|nr:MAG: YicC family protein [Firmicutes bacterium HGW-Firmicutes-15]
MLKSMTGFGRSQVNENGYEISCELKGVNHRFFDAHIRIPRRYAFLEDRVKDELKKNLSRGRLEIGINIEKTNESARKIKVDKDLAIAYYDSLKDLAENLNISPDITVVDIFRLPDIFNLADQEEDPELIWLVLKKTLDVAIGSLVEMRCKEGANLGKDILARNAYILSEVEILEKRSPLVAQEYQEKLRNRINEMLSSSVFDEGRLLQEVAIFADKASITEEIVRLKSHIKHLDELLQDGDSIGRKCDFLVQEMFREINTVASKANDIQMSQVVVEVKAELEKIREQLQNIE